MTLDVSLDARAPVSVQRYGADASGLVCGFVFSPTAPGRPVDAEQVIAWLAQSRSTAQEGDGERGDIEAVGNGNGDEFLWLHFHLAHSASERWMSENLALPDSFFEALREGSHSTRIEQQDGALLSVLNDVMFDFQAMPTEVATLWGYSSKYLMVTARTKPLRSVDRLRASVRDGELFNSPVALLEHLLRDQADLMVQIVRRSSTEVDRIEDQFLAHRPKRFSLDLGALRRVLVRFQRTLAPEPGSIFRLLARPPRFLSQDDLQGLREATEEFSLVLGDLAGLVERIKLLQEEIATRLEERSSRTLFTLTMVTVLALPINIIAGFFGMNVGGVPLANNKNGFWLLVFIVATFTLVAGWWAFRRSEDR